MDDKGENDFKDRLNQLYLAVILRYRDYIEEKENLSVAELPRLVTPESPLVSRTADEIKGESYIYEANFYDASIRAQEFVRETVDEILLPVQFWILPDETIKFRLGDSIDSNILLCSLLIRLGNPSTKVLINIRDDERKAYVYYEFNNSIYLLDINEEAKAFPKKEDMLKLIGIDENSTAYEFNDKMFLDIY
jgi:hypothetical protein